jgi:uncharacterized protein involved in outer membrane biogenesis
MVLLVRHWRRYLAVALVIIVLPVIGLGVAAAVVDPNDFKPQISAAVLAATGRELTLGGELRVSASLWPTIEITDVKLANLPGGSRPDIARVEKILARLSLSGLLWRRLEITRITLIGPNILFELVNGKPNWIFNQGAHPDSTPSGSPSRLPVSLRIRDFRVQNGMITSKLPARTKVVGIQSLRLQHQADGGPIELASTLVYSDYQPYTLTASAQPAAGASGAWTTQMDFAAYDARVSAKGTLNVAGNYDLQLDAAVPALETLNALLP